MATSRSHRPAPTAALAAAAAVATIVALVVLLAAPTAARAATRSLGAGTATFRLDSVETATLMDDLLMPFPVAPAKLSFTTTTATLSAPVSGGSWNTSTGRGTFRLRGGLTYILAEEIVTQNGTSGQFVPFTMSGWRVGVGTSTGVSVAANGTRTSRFLDQSLNGTASVITLHGHRYVKVTKLGLTFNTTSAGAISGVLLGRGPNAGDPFASVTLLARLK